MSVSVRLPLAVALALSVGCGGGDKATDTGAVGGDDAVDADGDGVAADEDCDDNSAATWPGATELCDGLDNNCDGVVDEGVLLVFYGDRDGDGFGAVDDPIEACAVPADAADDATDCDDLDPDSYPGAAERCDDVDNDCDGDVDEDVSAVWYADADGDGYGDAESGFETCDPPPGYVDDATDCDDTAPTALPGGVEVCDEIDNDCDGEVDEGVTTTWYVDVDLDGFGVSDSTTEACAQPTGYAGEAGDCDDGDGAVNPAATELCNGVDDDCDGSLDGDDAADALTWYADADADGYADADTTTVSCDAGAGWLEMTAGASWDCDDAEGAVNPGAAEVCNAIDDDCNGLVDTDDAALTDGTTFYIDHDADGYGAADYTQVACAAPVGFVSDATDCDDLDAGAWPGADELCDGTDNDCDGDIDEDSATDASAWYADTDGDGYGDETATTVSCDAPSGSVSDDSDCDDGDAAISPAASEVCDEVDNNCDGDVDEDGATGGLTWYTDSDGDGYGDDDTETLGCALPSGAVEDSGDCDDADATSSPDGVEVCDGADNDCDGDVDEAEEVAGEGADCPASGCLGILADRPAASDGIYWIDPLLDGDPFEAECDMTSDGGGWTLVLVADKTEVEASDPPDFTYDSTVWTGDGYGSVGDDTHISAAWDDTPIFSELWLVQGSSNTIEAATTVGALADWSKSTGSIMLNISYSSSYGPYGGRVFTSWTNAICNTGNASTNWGAGLGAVRSCQHTYGTLDYEFASSDSTVELWVR